MPRLNNHLLLHPLFILNLLVLIANDHWWKYEYTSMLTGKLSDFAGVFVLAVFLIACFPVKRMYSIGFTAIFFIWWKSPLSEPFLHAIDQLFGVQLIRVIDYTDLFALFILPLAWRLQPYSFTGYISLRKYAVVVVGSISIAAIMATTPARMWDYTYPPGYVMVDKSWKTPLTINQFFTRLDSLNIPYRTENTEFLPIYRNEYVLRIKTDTGFRWQPLNPESDSALFFQKMSDTFYVIPYLALEKDTIRNIQFRIYDQGKKRRLELKAMTIAPGFEYSYYMKRPVRKKYWAIFKSFMLE